ncbi:MAG: hypothetical protein ACH349_01575 [Candidatus Rhabdochlamydia sp.]
MDDEDYDYDEGYDYQEECDTEEHKCICGIYCLECLGLSNYDFM